MPRAINEQHVNDFLGDLSSQHRRTGYGGAGGFYEIGRVTRSNRHNPVSMSADAAIMSSAESMDRRMRHMYGSQTKIKRGVDLMRDLIVGSGVNTFADPINHSFGCFLDRRSESELFRAFDYALESDDEFLYWASDKDRCDVNGKQSFFEMQRNCVSEAAQVGDGIIKFVFCKVPPGEVPFKLQAIEKEYLDRNRDTQLTDRGGKIVSGFEFDADGYELGMWVFPSHPYDHISVMKSVFVPEHLYVHYFKKSRPAQNIGVNWAHASGIPVFKRAEWLQVELRKQIKQSQHVFVHHTDNASELGFGLDPDDRDETGAPVALGNDPVAVQVGKNDKIEMLESQGLPTNADKMLDILDTDMANGMNLSPYSFTSRFEKVNQSGFRGAMQLEANQIAPLQMGLGSAVVLPVRRQWNRLAVASGILKTVSPADYVRESRRYDRFDCIGPGRILLDAEMEMDTAIGQIRGGLSTLKIQAAKLGQNYIQLLRQIKLENILCEKLGITLDHSKGQGGQPTKNTRSMQSGRTGNAESIRDVVMSILAEQPEAYQSHGQTRPY